jgi:hypothetical protein
MTPWWSDTAAAWFGAIGGGGGGALCGLVGSVIGVLVPRGIGRRVIVPVCILMAGIGACALAAGVVAVAGGQPYHVFFPLLLTGFIVTAVMGGMSAMVIIAYRRIEERKMRAEELRRG